ncbi:CxxH/CxxC protein [Planococcus rifietoensis]|uniref:CxxH/CxxC protein n=2 Tax=Planococcus rifietoensis TaxID=200991 RepID=UPI003850DAD3
MCITVLNIRKSKGGVKMELYCCQTHVGQGLDEFVAKTESYPILTELSDIKKLSTKCNYCEEQALYLVADK